MAKALLERLHSAADPNRNERTVYRDSDIESSVVQHLDRILNTRQGSALTCPDYGLVEVSDVLYDFPDAIGIVQRSLKNCIQTYEPRLKNVQVRPIKNEVGNVITLEFEITAQLNLPDGRRQALRVATAVDASGNVKVSS